MTHPRGYSSPRHGTVVAFDEDRGIGTIVGADSKEYPFHCTAVADGTRQISAGTEVVFEVAAGHLGRVEARGIVSVG